VRAPSRALARTPAAEAFAPASSTSGTPASRFYEIHAREAALEHCHAIYVSLEDTIAAGRVSTQRAKQRERTWGARSAVYADRVLGAFAAGDEDGVIPRAWAELANEHWHDLELDELPAPSVVGVDVVRCGADKPVLCRDAATRSRRLGACQNRAPW
jgi:hypothetical protein